MATPTRDEVIAELRGLQAGIQKNLATFTFIVASKTYSGAEALAVVETAVASAQAVLDARGTLSDALVADKRCQTLNGATLKAFRSIIGLMYTDHTTLLEFAIAPKKVRTPLTNDALVLRAAKARATRTKRKTLGKRQRAAIKGEVTGVVITPVTSETSAAAAGAAVAADTSKTD
jgi:hypothetical protein